MKTRKVIHAKNLSMRSPLVATVAFWLALDYWHAPGWGWGVVGTIMGVLWIAWIVDCLNVEQKDIFE